MKNKVKTIVAIIWKEELGRKCFQYWPEKEGQYRNLLVQTQVIKNTKFYIENLITLVDECGHVHEVRHLHVTQWPDHSIFDQQFSSQFAQLLDLVH